MILRFPLSIRTKVIGLHVISTNRVSLQPHLLSSVRADVDAEPIGNFPSYEDLEVSEAVARPRPALGPTNQTHIVFFPGEDTQQVEIANTVAASCCGDWSGRRWMRRT
jgi:hypothetical protein